MAVLDWLLDSDPAIRWQVLRDLAHAPAEAVAERARVAAEGWGARLLALQGEDGQWAGGACFPARDVYHSDRSEGQPWISTLPTLQLLHDFGIDPRADRVQRAVALVRDHCRWEHEMCIRDSTTINRRFGRKVGDEVLMEVAQHLGQLLPANSELFRWSGTALAAVVEIETNFEDVNRKLVRIASGQLEKKINEGERSVFILTLLLVQNLSGTISHKDVVKRMHEFVSLNSSDE